MEQQTIKEKQKTLDELAKSSCVDDLLAAVRIINEQSRHITSGSPKYIQEWYALRLLHDKAQYWGARYPEYKMPWFSLEQSIKSYYEKHNGKIE